MARKKKEQPAHEEQNKHSAPDEQKKQNKHSANDAQEHSEEQDIRLAWREAWTITRAKSTAEWAAKRSGLPINEVYLDSLTAALESQESLPYIEKLLYDSIGRDIKAIMKKYTGKEKNITISDIVGISEQAKKLTNSFEEALNPIAEAMRSLLDFTTSDTFKAIEQEAERVRNYLIENDVEAEISTEKAGPLYLLYPFIQMVIDEEYPDITIKDVIEQCTATGRPKTALATEIIEEAEARQAIVESVDTINSISKSIEKATDAEKLEIAKRELPKLGAYLPIFQSKPTSVFPFIGKNSITSIDERTQSAAIEKFDIEAFIENYEEVKASLRISTDKLLSFAIYLFTLGNNKKNSTVNCSISFDLRDYAYRLGYTDVFPRDNTDKEKKRANKRLDKVQKNVNEDLDLLFSLAISWTDTDPGKRRDKHNFNRVRILEGRGEVKNRIVSLSFTPTFAAYLVNRNVIGQYPAKLLLMDGRKATPYRIARKLFEHYFIDNNIINATNDILSIRALLPYTGLASYEEIQKTDRGHWIERIKEPIETALDELTQMQILSDWEYTRTKKQPLSDEEAEAITDYYDYEALYLHFIPSDTLDQHERIEKKQQQIEEAKERKEKRKQAAIKRNMRKKADKEKDGQGAD